MPVNHTRLWTSWGQWTQGPVSLVSPPQAYFWLVGPQSISAEWMWHLTLSIISGKLFVLNLESLIPFYLNVGLVQWARTQIHRVGVIEMPETTSPPVPETFTNFERGLWSSLCLAVWQSIMFSSSEEMNNGGKCAHCIWKVYGSYPTAQLQGEELLTHNRATSAIHPSWKHQCG